MFVRMFLFCTFRAVTVPPFPLPVRFFVCFSTKNRGFGFPVSVMVITAYVTRKVNGYYFFVICICCFTA